MEDQKREQYEAPVVTDYGDLNELTGGSSSGDRLDADFPVGTSLKDITLSS